MFSYNLNPLLLLFHSYNTRMERTTSSDAISDEVVQVFLRFDFGRGIREWRLSSYNPDTGLAP